MFSLSHLRCTDSLGSVRESFISVQGAVYQSSSRCWPRSNLASTLPKERSSQSRYVNAFLLMSPLFLPTPVFPTTIRVIPSSIPSHDSVFAIHNLATVYLLTFFSSSCGSQTVQTTPLALPVTSLKMLFPPTCLCLNYSYFSRPRFNKASSQNLLWFTFPITGPPNKCTFPLL